MKVPLEKRKQVYKTEQSLRRAIRDIRGENALSESKPFPHHKPSKVAKFLKAQEEIGGAKETWAFLLWVVENASLDWLANFGWKDIDLYLVFCKGAIKEWRLKTKRVKRNRARNARERQIMKDEFESRPEDKEVGW